MLLVLHGAFARCALLAQPATPSGSAPSPPHTCAGVRLPCLTVAFIAVPDVSPPLRAPTMRGKPPPRPLLATAAALRLWRLSVRPTGPRRFCTLTGTYHVTSMLLPAHPPLARDRGYASWCIAPRLAVALCTLRPCAAIYNTYLVAFFTSVFEGGVGDSACLWGGTQSKSESSLAASRRYSTTPSSSFMQCVPRLDVCYLRHASLALCARCVPVLPSLRH